MATNEIARLCRRHSGPPTDLVRRELTLGMGQTGRAVRERRKHHPLLVIVFTEDLVVTQVEAVPDTKPVSDTEPVSEVSLTCDKRPVIIDTSLTGTSLRNISPTSARLTKLFPSFSQLGTSFPI